MAGKIAVGLGHDNIAIAFSAKGWLELLSVIRQLSVFTSVPNAESRVIELLLDHDEHRYDPTTAEHLLVFRRRQTATTEMALLLSECCPNIGFDEWYCLGDTIVGGVCGGQAYYIGGGLKTNAFKLRTVNVLDYQDGVSHDGMPMVFGGVILTLPASAPVTLRNPGVPTSTPTSTPVSVKANANDHTCHACGNTACNKTERSCWMCGTAIKV